MIELETRQHFWAFLQPFGVLYVEAVRVGDFELNDFQVPSLGGIVLTVGSTLFNTEGEAQAAVLASLRQSQSLPALPTASR